MKVPAEALAGKLASLPEGVSVDERFEALVVGEEVGDRGRGYRNEQELWCRRPRSRRSLRGRGADVVLPQLIVDAGPAAVERFLQFLRGADREREDAGRVRASRGQFLAWCEDRGIGLAAIAPLHVAAYIRTHPGSVPTVKQHLAALRMLCDWLVVSQVLPVSPAAAVRGPKHVVTKGSTPVLTPAEARKLLEYIDTGTLPGLRDRALLSVMLYRLRAGERGPGDALTTGQPRPSTLTSRRAGSRGRREALFQSMDRAGERLTGRPLTRRVVLAMIKRRAAAGFPPSTCCHTFRATGDNGVSVERRDPRARPADRRPRVAEDDEALRPDG